MPERIPVVVKVNSGESKIEYDEKAGLYRAWVKSKPEKGKANAEIINLIRKEFGKKAIITGGKTSKKKIIEII